MDIHTATEEAYKRGYEAAEREYKQKLTRMGETIQELADQLMDLDSRKSDIEKWKEALPHLTECPLCHSDLTFADCKLRTLRSGDFVAGNLSKDQIAMRQKRAMMRLWKQIKEHVTVRDEESGTGHRIISTEITIIERGKKQ